MRQLPRQLITLSAAAEQLGVCTRTIRRWISEGELRAYRVGPRILRVDQADLDKLLRPLPTLGRSPRATGRC
jgi:excisionase family DNA binding protein